MNANYIRMLSSCSSCTCQKLILVWTILLKGNYFNKFQRSYFLLRCTHCSSCHYYGYRSLLDLYVICKVRPRFSAFNLRYVTKFNHRLITFFCRNNLSLVFHVDLFTPEDVLLWEMKPHHRGQSSYNQNFRWDLQLHACMIAIDILFFSISIQCYCILACEFISCIIRYRRDYLPFLYSFDRIYNWTDVERYRHSFMSFFFSDEN